LLFDVERGPLGVGPLCVLIDNVGAFVAKLIFALAGCGKTLLGVIASEAKQSDS
jgi:hypothetical protein